MLRGFQACKSVFVFFWLLVKDRNRTNLFSAFRSFLNLLEGFAHNERYTPEIVVSHIACFIPKDDITLNESHVRERLREATNF